MASLKKPGTRPAGTSTEGAKQAKGDPTGAQHPLPASFYLPPPDTVAQALLGKLITHRLEGIDLTGRIVEVEAYSGAGDPAAHAFNGKTDRNAVLFGPPGHAYVYFIYGMYYCLNLSCEPAGRAGCVLIRALEPVAGMETMAELRGLAPGAKPRLLTSGPGRLCQALGLTRAAHNGVDVTDPASPLLVHDDGYRPASILATPRIGIRKAVDWPHRFLIEGNPCVSGPKHEQLKTRTPGISPALHRGKVGWGGLEFSAPRKPRSPS